MENETVKEWRCENGHVMGLVIRKHKVRNLLLLREATKDPNGINEETEVMAVVEGYVADVRCSICGAMRTWFPGQEALRKLLRSMKREEIKY